jgi:hypothetical protein
VAEEADDDECVDVNLHLHQSPGLAMPSPYLGGFAICILHPEDKMEYTADDEPTHQARANKPATGDLAKKLSAQKKQTQNQTLQQAAAENRQYREADAVLETRNYN